MNEFLIEIDIIKHENEIETLNIIASSVYEALKRLKDKIGCRFVKRVEIVGVAKEDGFIDKDTLVYT